MLPRLVERGVNGSGDVELKNPRNFMVTKLEHLGTSKLRTFSYIHNECDLNDIIAS